MRCHSLLAPLVLLALSASPAAALSFDPDIDFRDGSIWSGANHQPSFSGTEAGIGLTINATPRPATLWQDSQDGLGIRLSYEDDEIESSEVLQVVFADEVSLGAIYLADLFEEGGYIESGAYRINGGAWQGFDAASLPGTGSNGEHAIFFGDAIDGVSIVEFSAPGRIARRVHHEFALLGFDVEAPTGATPEPGAALLFGLGLLVTAQGVRRR